MSDMGILLVLITGFLVFGASDDIGVADEVAAQACGDWYNTITPILTITVSHNNTWRPIVDYHNMSQTNSHLDIHSLCLRKQTSGPQATKGTTIKTCHEFLGNM
jgi:hypothetical protein